MEQFPSFKQFSGENNFLKTERQQQDVYEASHNLANYLKETKIPNIMFLDNSARQAYIGLKEAWKEVDDDTVAEPTIYFINPEALKKKTFSSLEAEFWRKYKHLDPEEAILLYDACIHSGETIEETKKFFDYLGFKDVKLAVTSTGDNCPDDKKEILDFVCLDHRAAAGCRPFGRPGYVEKNDGHLLSQKIDSQMQRDKGKIEHQRIKEIFKD
jgi:hypothetical protein